ncbi:carbon storage regulator CsrA [Campylobacter sputorum]|uniref:carbon storage regulator CsrA n=1 Tax=Campylobacter sputorum TaxID=206 RepID=UPI0018793F25|nr:carbon storage regulator CsrA [Campylobacter sp. RM11302]MBE7358162.1 carbon storage regulator CsrA [Campylobacter sp. RM11302]
MLILSRKEDEVIKLGNDVTIKIVSIAKGGVKVGIDAPKDMMILRGELANDVTQENIQASKQSRENLSKLSEKLKK